MSSFTSGISKAVSSVFGGGGSSGGGGKWDGLLAAARAKGNAGMTPPSPTPPPVNAPDIAAAAANVDADEQARADAQLKKKGRAATLLTGEQGAGTPKTATKVLTGE